MFDQQHKTLRSFYCEDAIWEMYEVMTRDLDSSMDYLINEAMRHYAHSRNYSLSEMSRRRAPEPEYQQPGYGQYPQQQPPPPAHAPARPTGRMDRSVPPPPAAAPPPPPAHKPPPAPRPPSQPVFSQSAPTQAMPAVSGPRSSRPSYSEAQPAQDWHQPQPQRSQGFAQAARQPTTPRLPPPPPPPPAAAPQRPGYGSPQPPVRSQPARPPLYLFFNGQRYLVDKDRFVIGRGSQNTDLTIRDGNISRKHAAVIFHGGAYYIQDLGSTNGVEYKGTKVESKQVEEGDVFSICDYEIRFSYID